MTVADGCDARERRGVWKVLAEWPNRSFGSSSASGRFGFGCSIPAVGRFAGWDGTSFRNSSIMEGSLARLWKVRWLARYLVPEHLVIGRFTGWNGASFRNASAW